MYVQCTLPSHPPLFSLRPKDPNVVYKEPTLSRPRSPTRVPESTDNVGGEVSDGSSLEYDDVTPESLQLSHQSQMPNLHTVSVTRGPTQVEHYYPLSAIAGIVCTVRSWPARSANLVQLLREEFYEPSKFGALALHPITSVQSSANNVATTVTMHRQALAC